MTQLLCPLYRSKPNNSVGQIEVPDRLTNVVAVAAGGTLSFALASNAPPLITRDPVDQTAYDGRTVVFSAAASGCAPLEYQWQHNGTNVEHATNASLVIPNVQFSDSGAYRLLVTNSFGAVSSAEASLTVTSSPPVILSQPLDQTTYSGGTVVFQIATDGSGPWFYQWYFNGVALSNATDSTLEVNHVTANQVGLYSVLVSNAYGMAVSSNALLKLSPVAAWGVPFYVQTAIPPNLTNVLAIAAGGYHNVALNADGTVTAWGYNEHGETDVPADLTNVVAISAGYNFNLALRANGTLATWGVDWYGLRNIPPELTNVVAISAGNTFSLALKADGKVVAWGLAWYGAISVPAKLTNAIAIAAGQSYSLALTRDGNVVAWGLNTYGQTNVPIGLTRVVAIAAGNHHAMALKGDGTIICWGECPGNQPNLRDVVGIEAGNGFNVVIKRDRTAVVWGALEDAPTGLTNVLAVAGSHGSAAPGSQNHCLALAGEPATRPTLLNPRQSGTSFTVAVTTVRGRSYRLDFRNSLTDQSWTMLPPLPGDGSQQTLVDRDADGATRHYRVQELR